MKSIFNTPERNELIDRIHTLNENSAAQWGKINVYQMIKHCIHAAAKAEWLNLLTEHDVRKSNGFVRSSKTIQ